MPFRRCLILFFISLNLFAEDLYIELENKDVTIWEASYPINVSYWEINGQIEIPLPEFEYIHASAPYILTDVPQVSLNTSNRWGGGFIYDNNERVGLLSSWGSSQYPLHLKNVVFYGKEQSGLFSTLDWITGSRLSMNHAFYIADKLEMKNQWVIKTDSLQFTFKDIYKNNLNTSSAAYFLFDADIELQKKAIGFQGSFDTYRNEGNIHLLYSYKPGKYGHTGLKAGYVLADNRNINASIFAQINRVWEWSFATGYEKVIQPSFDFDETRSYSVYSDLYDSPHFYADIHMKRNMNLFSMDSSIIWRSLTIESLQDSFGGEIELSFHSGTEERIPIGLSAGFAYNKHLVSPEDLSAMPQWSGVLMLDVPLWRKWNMNSRVILDQEGMFKASFLINGGGTYVGNV